MYPLAALLQERLECTVSGILLPGHGSHPSFLNRTTWKDWFNTVQDEIQYLLSGHDRVDVVGLSMGGLLAIYAGVHIPHLQSIITINAPIINRFRLIALAPLLQWVFPHFPKPKQKRAYLQGKDRFAYKVYPLKALSSMLKLRKIVKAEIAQLTTPILIIQAQQDESVDPRSLEWLSQHIKNAPQDVMRLERSEHIATMGPELAILTDRVIEFLQAHE
jgi:carboxylesterase